ncbi:hypothetical protein EVAR_60658_1 [Eumeta japonica]|uniref:Uncharacterized protein n=1 Tax=Eumeta variegata TaxID=151549 RepID=A0A4C1ZN37_EUMVA|nr:hypothetical protein EVAR_60658_1 [Eumeta japonica]
MRDLQSLTRSPPSPPENRASRRRTAPKQNNYWRKVSPYLEETDTPILNNIPDNIETTDETTTLQALTKHTRQWSRTVQRSRRSTTAETT